LFTLFTPIFEGSLEGQPL